MGDTVFDNGCAACEASCVGICLECYKASRAAEPPAEQSQAERDAMTPEELEHELRELELWDQTLADGLEDE